MLTEREKSLTRGVMAAVKDLLYPLREENAALRTEVEILKARLAERPVPKDGAPGRDGKDAPPVDEDALFRRLKMELPALIPAPIPGKDAPAVDAESLFLRLKAELPALIPAPIKGEKGDKGDRGQDGLHGEAGPRGDPGRDGKDGADGLNGKDGASGADGKDGRNGIDGKDGVAGLAGKDGAPGRDGLDGKNGADGLNGKDGRDGKDVDMEVVRAMVVNAVKELPVPKDGKDGRDGRDGKDGLPGTAGRDAAAIDFVTMDTAKSYPRGTFALHKAGVWFAERGTEGMDGWRLIAPGIAGIKAGLLSDGRTFEFAFERTDGSTETHRVKAAIPKHNGVWREAVAYEPGDQVQLSGSSWIAREVTTDKPGDSKAWELVARRGRDGKDAA